VCHGRNQHHTTETACTTVTTMPLTVDKQMSSKQVQVCLSLTQDRYDYFLPYLLLVLFYFNASAARRSQWPRGLRRGSTAECFLGSWARIPPGAWMCLLRELYVVRYRSVCRADHSSRGVLLSVVCECDREASRIRKLWPVRGCCTIGKKYWLIKMT
jgi:hypothetical protein